MSTEPAPTARLLDQLRSCIQALPEEAVQERDRLREERDELIKAFLHVFPYTYYRDQRSDLSSFDDHEIAMHFLHQGIREGVSLKETAIADTLKNLRDDNTALPINIQRGGLQENSAQLAQNEAILEQVANLVLNLFSSMASGKTRPLLSVAHLNRLEKLAQEANLIFSPSRYGPIFHLETSDLISKSIKMYGEWAHSELELLLTFVEPGSVVIDLGACIGYHARAFSNAAGPSGSVYCLEPNQNVLDILGLNAAIAEFANIHIYPVGAASCEKNMYLSQEAENIGASSIHQNPLTEDSQAVKCTSLDDLLRDLDKIDLIKLDIEGMEHDALQGALGIIGRFKPVIYAEINTVKSAHDLISWSNTNDYAVLACLHEAYNPDNFNNNDINFFGDGMECGVLLTPFKDRKIIRPEIAGTKLYPIRDIDDAARVLARKPQYWHHVVMPMD